MAKDAKLTTIGGVPNRPRYAAGSSRSVARLKHLEFDPIKKLVDVYKELEAEVEYQKGLRDGTVIELMANGRQRAYRAEVHHALYDRLTTIGKELLRYGYGRVPEVGDGNTPKASKPLVINLTGRGQQVVVNPPSDDSGQPEIDDWDADEQEAIEMERLENEADTIIDVEVVVKP